MKVFLKYLTLPLITACIVAIGVIIFYYLDKSKGTDLAVPSRGTDAPGEQVTASEVHTAKEANHSPQIATSHKDFVYPIDGTRDPFQQVSIPVDTQRPPGSAVKQPSIMLTGVIWDEEDPIAIITDSENNSYLVRAGEEIGKAKVLAIRLRSITIESDGKTQELVLWPAKL